MLWLFLALAVFVSCKEEQHEAHFEKTRSERLIEKKRLYCDLSAPTVKSRGYSVTRCDGLLFTALRGISCGDIDVSHFESEVEPGQWFRDPEKSCFIPDSLDNGSDSTISKDMLLGLMHYFWYSRDLNGVNRTIDYGKAHSWVMGEAKDDITLASKCLMPPGQISILYDIQSKLSAIPLTTTNTDIFSENTGFRAHLDVLAILLGASVRGTISTSQVETLKAQAKRQPRNALYQAAYALYTDGNQSATEALLFDESRFPKDALPTTKNICSDYLWTDDDTPSDYEPCPDHSETYEGLDLIIAASVANGSFFKKKPTAR